MAILSTNRIWAFRFIVFFTFKKNPEKDPFMIAWPLLKIGMSYDIENKRKMALDYYNSILQMENGAGAQFLAEKYIDEPAERGDPFLGY